MVLWPSVSVVPESPMTGVGEKSCLRKHEWFSSPITLAFATDCEISQGQGVGLDGQQRISLSRSSIYLPLD